MKAHFVKLPNGTLAPDEPEAVEWLSHVRMGQAVSAEVKKPRNYEFHKKLFALLHYAFDVWEPPEDGPGKNFDRFRKEIIMLAGYYDLVPSVKGEVRAEAKSISFAKMDEVEFSKLYDSVVNVLLKWVLKNYTRADVDRVMTHILDFAA